MPRPLLVALLLLGLLLLVHVPYAAPQSFIGINYGDIADNLPPPASTARLLKSTTIGKVRLYRTDPAVVAAFAGTSISLLLGAANADIPSFASSPSAASPSGSPRVFRPADSKSWAPFPCSSDTCKSYVPFSLANCSAGTAPCAYDYRYKDNSSARGVVGTDAATVALSGSRGGGADRKAKLQQVVLGCTTSYDGQSFQASDGVLSLGNSNISFAARAAARFGGRFSYCLVDHLAPRNTSSYLTFGPDANGAASSSRTPLLLDAQVAPFYAVTVDAVSVAGEALDIPAEVWDVKKSGGAILDSGTSLTILATPAYKAVVAALSKQLAGVPRVTMDPFEYCYNWTATSTPPAVPKLEVRFAGSARLQPPTKSYVIDAAPGVKCIGLQEGVWPGVSVIGNILQQEHLWEFDLANRWLRFKESRCAQ